MWRQTWQRAVDWTLCGGGRGTLVYKDRLLLQMSAVGGCKAVTLVFDGIGVKDNLTVAFEGGSETARRPFLCGIEVSAEE